MITQAEAEEIIRESVALMPAAPVDLRAACGRILREEVRAERPAPPFDRVTMDGIAISFSAWETGQRAFRLEGIQAAGQPVQMRKARDGCLEVMTGAPLPGGCDAVVPVEELRFDRGAAIVTGEARVEKGRNIHPRGSDHPAGAVILPCGRRLGSREIGAAASAGRAELHVSTHPRIAVVATGDELVEPGKPVADHEIYLSNAYALQSALDLSGFRESSTYHLRDNESDVLEGLSRILDSADLVILSGGVSKGRFDYVPATLENLGVRRLFHGVRQRPGRPFWFGLSRQNRAVFALPGNPLSTLVCLHRYVLPALVRMTGAEVTVPLQVRLQSPVRFTPRLTWFLPVVLSSPVGGLLAQPVPPNTSGDYTSVLETDGFIELPAERADFPAGFGAPFYRWV